MRILYDTNVLVTMLSRREAVIELKNRVTKGNVTHVTSMHILSEVESVLAERMGLTKRRAKAATRLIARISQIVEPTNVERLSRDPYDDYILAAAMSGQANYLITEDKDLLVLKDKVAIRIVTLAEFQRL